MCFIDKRKMNWIRKEDRVPGPGSASRSVRVRGHRPPQDACSTFHIELGLVSLFIGWVSPINMWLWEKP